MYMFVTPLRCKGVALDPKERRRQPPLKGDVNVRCDEDKQMGRRSNVASLRASMPMDPDLLPPLVDALSPGWRPMGSYWAVSSSLMGVPTLNPGGVDLRREGLLRSMLPVRGLHDSPGLNT